MPTRCCCVDGPPLAWLSLSSCLSKLVCVCTPPRTVLKLHSVERSAVWSVPTVWLVYTPSFELNPALVAVSETVIQLSLWQVCLFKFSFFAKAAWPAARLRSLWLCYSKLSPCFCIHWWKVALLWITLTLLWTLSSRRAYKCVLIYLHPPGSLCLGFWSFFGFIAIFESTLLLNPCFVFTCLHCLWSNLPFVKLNVAEGFNMAKWWSSAERQLRIQAWKKFKVNTWRSYSSKLVSR